MLLPHKEGFLLREGISSPGGGRYLPLGTHPPGAVTAAVGSSSESGGPAMSKVASWRPPATAQMRPLTLGGEFSREASQGVASPAWRPRAGNGGVS